MIEGVIYRYKSPSGKYYIGQTIDEERRRKNFIRDITYAGDKINYARKKYGPENFEYTILMKVIGDDKEGVIRYLNVLEPFFIKQYNSIENGYNSSEGGKNGLLSEYTKKKMSEVRTGHKTSEETKRKISEKHKGKIFSEETKKKMSDSRKGKIPGNKGKSMTAEQRLKMSIAKKGKPSCNKGRHLSEEHKRHISESNRKKMTDERRLKISIAVKGSHRVYNPDGTWRMIKDPDPIIPLW